MKTFIKTHRTFTGMILFLLLVSTYTLVSPFSYTTKADSVVVNDTPRIELEDSRTFGYAVGGVVEATDSITVRALADGTVQEKYVHVGDFVKKNDVLLVQKIPLLGERALLQSEQNKLTSLMEEASVIGRMTEENKASLQQETGATTVALTKEQAETGVESASSLLATQLYGSLTNLTNVLDFIDTHKSYFSADDLNSFRQSVHALYGSSQPYLGGTMRYTFADKKDILTFLNDATKGTIYPDIDTLVHIGGLLDGEMEAARKVLIGGEQEFLDRTTVTPQGELYNAYFSIRGSLLESQANLRSVLASARTASVGGDTSTHTAQINQSLLEIGYVGAEQMSKNAHLIQGQSQAVSTARMSLVAGEQELGAPKAPFDGFIEKVFVKKGEFVQQGSPIVTLVGDGMRELHVSIPREMLPYLREGALFILEENIVGSVSRFSKTATNGSIEVVIDLLDSAFLPGSTLYGEIQLSTEKESALVVPYAFVHFDGPRAFVRSENGEDVAIKIIYDSGTQYIVEPRKPIQGKVQKMIGIAL